MDPEAPIRTLFKDRLAPYFQVYEEVGLRSRFGDKVRCDILLIGEFREKCIIFAIEIKSTKPNQAKNYRDTYRQAYNYVGATGEIAGIGKFTADYAFIFQNIGMEYIDIKRRCQDMDMIEQYFMMRGIDMAFNSLDVGNIEISNDDFLFRLGSNLVWSIEKRWTAEMERRFY